MFIIKLNQLRGSPFVIKGEFDPSFIDVIEEDLKFVDKVFLDGKIELSSSLLLFTFNIETLATIPCIICNDPIKYPLSIKNFFHSEDITEHKGLSYDYKEILREALLLDLPSYLECNNKCCPERQNLNKYIKSNVGETNGCSTQ